MLGVPYGRKGASGLNDFSVEAFIEKYQTHHIYRAAESGPSESSLPFPPVPVSISGSVSEDGEDNFDQRSPSLRGDPEVVLGSHWQERGGHSGGRWSRQNVNHYACVSSTSYCPRHWCLGLHRLMGLPCPSTWRLRCARHGQVNAERRIPE